MATDGGKRWLYVAVELVVNGEGADVEFWHTWVDAPSEDAAYTEGIQAYIRARTDGAFHDDLVVAA